MYKWKFYLLLSALCCASLNLHADIRLPRLISDGLVLQRDTPLKIWGWADPGEKIKLSFRGKNYRTTADAAGDWSVPLAAQPAGGPYEMTISGNNELQVRDILFGDVWICSGQSNMVLPMERVKENYPEEVRSANYPQIRNFFIATATNLDGPAPDLSSGSWKMAKGEDVLGFSATAYFFAKHIYDRYQVPIGLINASVGGTPIEAWIGESGLQEFPNLMSTVQQNQDQAYIDSINNLPRNRMRTSEDAGLAASPKWFEEGYKPIDWHPINVPGYFEDQGLRDFNGVVWYWKEIDIPQEMAGAEAKLFLGRIVDADFAYVNGTQVGNITYQYPPRRYTIPAGVLKAGKNTITVRVLNYGNKGGFVPDKPYFLTANGRDIDLKGTWHYRVGEVFPPVQRSGGNFSRQNQPTALFNAMIAPLQPVRVKGWLWYQGESNSGNPRPYYDLLPALIANWRKLWDQGPLPFLYVQLTNFMEVDYLPVESNWAVLRDAQLQGLQVPNTAMAVAIDIGEWNDIHPLNKQDVGVRLALGARKLAYGEQDLVHSGPLLETFRVDGDRIVLQFKANDSDLALSKGDKPAHFAIAGADRHFVWADAEITGAHEITVRKEGIEHPEFVRYAWADNPRFANLINEAGLPASPFQVSVFPGVDEIAWNGKKCAVSLTYDDALNVHLDNAIPLLDSLRLKGTFYLTASSPAGSGRIEDWRRAAADGHELGNHTLFHPCDASRPGMSWVRPEYDLSTYSLDRITRELRMTNAYLEAIDGRQDRTFAFTCGHKAVAEGTFIQEMEHEFLAARAVRHEMHPIEEVDLMDVDCYSINGQSGEELIQLVQKAEAEGTLLVFLFHGVGGEHNLNVSLEAHRTLLRYLKERESEIWVAPMRDIAKHVQHFQQAK
ncbi:sialate O-acetylesterase [Flavilitoribacter nigricans]|uniref:NodB homology domain-containing protein n=1 Tax=Flavilitoribacter nigricans (strain ATCC 23147 / DSM 23189 / NBRC 102662 / NCIMB 1420 / SS-2) TaxID=1122177 RepID=A0A2D0NCM7_FLAN2|nr:sialate O-acetylesterase [Flavilitoribacter nigricans]PHN06261.1 hypothetical protein CRP01_11840 [Flavilitoribacter nigricans DSM 23189 = NBRC 102662]